MKVERTGSQCVLKGYAKNIHRARFDTGRYHSYREMHFNAMVDVKLRQSHLSVKSRSTAPGHSRA